MLKRSIVALASVAALTGHAGAADAVQEIVVVEEAFDWSGIYVGLDAGYAFGKSDVFIEEIANVPFNASLEPEGFIGGVHVGFNHQTASNLVLGVEADLMYNSLTDDILQGTGGAASLGMVIESDVKWSGSARVRAGYAMGRALPFVTAGVAAARYDATLFIIDTPEVRFPREETHVGWTAGAGFEYGFTQNWLGRVEYRYTDFGSEELVPGGEAAAEIDLKTQDVRIGLSYKF